MIQKLKQIIKLKVFLLLIIIKIVVLIDKLA